MGAGSGVAHARHQWVAAWLDVEPIWVLNAVLWGLLLVIVYFDLIDDGNDDKE